MRSFDFAARGCFAWLLMIVGPDKVRSEEAVPEIKPAQGTEAIRSNLPTKNNFVEIAERGVKLSGSAGEGYQYNFTSNNAATNSWSGKQEFNLYKIKLALEEALVRGSKETGSVETMGEKKAGVVTNLNLSGPSRLDLDSKQKNPGK